MKERIHLKNNQSFHAYWHERKRMYRSKTRENKKAINHSMLISGSDKNGWVYNYIDPCPMIIHTPHRTHTQEAALTMNSLREPFSLPFL